MEDALCDEGAVDMLVGFAVKELCPAFPDNKDECIQLAESLLPVAVEWLRASASPADLCSAVGVCGPSMQGDPAWDKTPAKLSDGFDCPVCKHVVAAVKREAGSAAGAPGGADARSRAELLSSAEQACRQLPEELALACSQAVDKRSALLRMAVGSAADRDTTAACELLGMCRAGLARFQPVPLSAPLVRHLAATQAAVRVQRVHSGAGGAAALQGQALGDNRCDTCKLVVLEVAVLLANPGFRQSILTYGEAVCDSAVPQSYTVMCKQYVDVYAPLLLGMLQQYVQQQDAVCARMGMCARPSLWQGLLTGLRAKGGALVGKVLRVQA